MPPVHSDHDSSENATTTPATVPPPTDEIILVPKAPAERRRRRVLVAALAGVLAIGTAYALARAHAEEQAPNASAIAPAPPVDLPARIERTVMALTAETPEQPCTTSDEEALPLVVYTSSDARPRERDLFPSAAAMTELDAKLAGRSRVAVLRTIELVEPEASVGMPVPGRYEGELVVIDVATGTAACHTRFRAWSSLSEPGIGHRTLQADFNHRVQDALAQAADRLNVAIEL